MGGGHGEAVGGGVAAPGPRTLRGGAGALWVWVQEAIRAGLASKWILTPGQMRPGFQKARQLEVFRRLAGPVESAIDQNAIWFVDNQGMSRGEHQGGESRKRPLQETKNLACFDPRNEHLQTVGPPLRDQKYADGIADNAAVRGSQGRLGNGDFAILGLGSVRNRTEAELGRTTVCQVGKRREARRTYNNSSRNRKTCFQIRSRVHISIW